MAKQSESNKANRLKLGAVGLLFVAAVGVWYWSGSAERAAQNETLAALKGVSYHVQCSACGKSFDIPATDYVTNSGPEGVKCIQCGQLKALRMRNSDEVDIADFKADVEKLTTPAEVSAAVQAAEAELEKVKSDLAAAETANDAAAIDTHRKARNRLTAKIQALNFRWSELQSSPG